MWSCQVICHRQHLPEVLMVMEVYCSYSQYFLSFLTVDYLVVPRDLELSVIVTREKEGEYNVTWQMLAWRHEREAVNNCRFPKQLFEARRRRLKIWLAHTTIRHVHLYPVLLPTLSLRHSRDVGSQARAPLFLSCTLKTIGEPTRFAPISKTIRDRIWSQLLLCEREDFMADSSHQKEAKWFIYLTTLTKVRWQVRVTNFL